MLKICQIRFIVSHIILQIFMNEFETERRPSWVEINYLFSNVLLKNICLSNVITLSGRYNHIYIISFIDQKSSKVDSISILFTDYQENYIENESIGRSKDALGTRLHPPPPVQFLSFSFSFGGKWPNNSFSRPRSEESSEKSWIRHWKVKPWLHVTKFKLLSILFCIRVEKFVENGSVTHLTR